MTVELGVVWLGEEALAAPVEEEAQVGFRMEVWVEAAAAACRRMPAAA